MKPVGVNAGKLGAQRLSLVLLVSVLVYVIPGGPLLILPLTLLNTHIHEICHVLAGIATGGGAERILVFQNGSGLALVSGGNLLMVASAGYLGAIALGGLALAYGRTARQADVILNIAIGVLAFSLLVFVRGDLVGLLSGWGWLGLLVLIRRDQNADRKVIVVSFLAAQQCLNALRSVSDLTIIARQTDAHSDARILQEATGIPDTFWAGLWAIAAIVTVFLALRHRIRSESGPLAPPR